MGCNSCDGNGLIWKMHKTYGAKFVFRCGCNPFYINYPLWSPILSDFKDETWPTNHTGFGALQSMKEEINKKAFIEKTQWQMEQAEKRMPEDENAFWDVIKFEAKKAGQRMMENILREPGDDSDLET